MEWIKMFVDRYFHQKYEGSPPQVPSGARRGREILFLVVETALGASLWGRRRESQSQKKGTPFTTLF